MLSFITESAKEKHLGVIVADGLALAPAGASHIVSMAVTERSVYSMHAFVVLNVV